MSDLYLQDTSFWILTHRRNTPESVARRSTELLRHSRVAINEVVRLEVLMGYRSEDDAARVSHELDGLEFLALDRPVWNETWLLGTRLKKLGLTKGFPDILIAATAIHYGATLLHRDSDFEAIAQHSDLRTESYLGAPYA